MKRMNGFMHLVVSAMSNGPSCVPARAFRVSRFAILFEVPHHRVGVDDDPRDAAVQTDPVRVLHAPVVVALLQLRLTAPPPVFALAFSPDSASSRGFASSSAARASASRRFSYTSWMLYASDAVHDMANPMTACGVSVRLSTSRSEKTMVLRSLNGVQMALMMALVIFTKIRLNSTTMMASAHTTHRMT